jgi:hypothetical protein
MLIADKLQRDCARFCAEVRRVEVEIPSDQPKHAFKMLVQAAIGELNDEIISRSLMIKTLKAKGNYSVFVRLNVCHMPSPGVG